MAYENAAQFLARALPWPVPGNVLPDFFVNIHVPYRLTNGKLTFPGRACQTVREAVNYIEFSMTRPRQPGDANPDVYVCMSGQRMAKAKQAKNGRIYYSAVRGISNAIWHKSFYIDVDVKADAYPSTAAAVDAVGAFIKSVGLPTPSYIVASGSGGFHVHWVVADALPTTAWLPVSQALVTAMRSHGLLGDYSVTTDAARLLRVPDTLNFKHSPPRPVVLDYAGGEYQLERITAPLEPFVGVVTAPVRRAATSHYAGLPAGLGPISKLAKPQELVPNQSASQASLRDLQHCCPFADKAEATGGRTYRQPLWYETAKLAFYTSEGRGSLHRMSNAHPTYTPSETDEMYDRIVAERTPVDMYGWPQCTTIQMAGATECAACPWMIAGRTAGRSPFHFLGEDWRQASVPKNNQSQPSHLVQPPSPAPIVLSNLAQPGVTSQVTYGDLPAPGYQHAADGIVMLDVPDPANPSKVVQVPVCGYPIRGLKPTTGKEEREQLISFETEIDYQTWVPISLPKSALTDARRLGSLLAGQGMALKEQQEIKNVGYMMSSFLEQLRMRKVKSSVSHENSGWSWEDGKPAAFVYGGTRYNSHGNTPAIMRDLVIRDLYHPVGERSVWDRAVKMITDQHRPAMECIVGAGFGATLMAFTGENCLAWHAYGPSGVHKSTALYVAQAEWGAPKEGVQKIGDSVNSLDKRAGVLRNLPLFFDELQTGDQTKAMQQLIFSMSQGKTKQRLTRGAQFQPTETFSTTLITAGNSSLIGIAAENNSEAGMYRIFEFDVSPPVNGLGILGDANQIKAALEQNYGHAGALFSEYLGKNATTMPTDLQATIEMVRQDVQASQAERFWVAGIATTILGSMIANKIGLTQFNIDANYRFLLATFQSLRRFVKTSDTELGTSAIAKKWLSDFINRNRSGMIITDTVASVGRGAIKPLNQADLNKGQRIVLQWAQNDRLLRVSKSALGHFLTLPEIGMQREPVFKSMDRELGAKRIRVSLAGGTSYGRAVEQVFELDLNHPALVDFLIQ